MEDARKQIVQVDQDEKEKRIIEYRKDRISLMKLNRGLKTFERYCEKQGRDLMIYEVQNLQLNGKLKFFNDTVSLKQELFNEIVERKSTLVWARNMELEKKRTDHLLESKENHKKIVEAYVTYSSENLKHNVKDVIENEEKVTKQLIKIDEKFEWLLVWKDHIRTEILTNWRSVCKREQAKYRNKMILLEREDEILKTKIDQYKKKIGELKKKHI